MPTALEAFDAVLLADAAYLKFDIQEGAVLSGADLVAALRSADPNSGESRMTEAKAEYIASRFDLVSYRQSDPDSNKGFAVCLPFIHPA